MITSLGPKKSRTKLFKLKAIVAKKKVLAIFSPNNDCNKPQGKVYKGRKGILTLSMGGIRSFLYNIVCWKQKILKKKDNLSTDEKILTFFLALSSVTNLRWQFTRVQKIFDSCCGSYKIFCVTPKRLLKRHFFEKKATFPEKKRFWPFFLAL